MGVRDVPERLVRTFDDQQGRRRWLALPVGVVRKYADDRGSALAGLVTFQVFLGMLPLLVLALTVFGRVLNGSAGLRQAVLQSTLTQFPVIGARIEDNVQGLGVSGPWLYVTAAALLWTATGIYNSFQLALNQVWNVGGVHRQGFLVRLLRALLLVLQVLVAAIGTSFLRWWFLPSGWPPAARDAAAVVASVVVATVTLLGVFRLAVAPAVPTGHLVPAAAVAGVAWAALQRLGRWIVLDRLSQAQDLYGAIGFVVVMLFWINLLARSAVLANEAAVVWRRDLWPRRIAQPPLSDADRRVLAGLVDNERRRPEEVVTVRFRGSDDPPVVLEEPAGDDGGRGGRRR